MKRVCVLLAPGFEEIEAITVIDVLRRADIETTVLGVEGRLVVGSHNIAVEADAELAEFPEGGSWDMVVLPGGMPGAKHLHDSAAVQELLVAQRARGRRLAAICAAPIALSRAGVLEGRKATSYPSFKDQLVCAEYLEASVVIDHDVITSRGPGTAIAFALAIVAELRGPDLAEQLAERMLV
jgi:4-methyl-5(b-hydroxyethyl)-thiazole monophosphate biosynthesis